AVRGGLEPRSVPQPQPAGLAHPIGGARRGMHRLAVPVIRARGHPHRAAGRVRYLREGATREEMRMADDLLRLEHGRGGDARRIWRIHGPAYPLSALEPGAPPIPGLAPALAA